MNDPVIGPRLRTLFGLFGPDVEPPVHEFITAERMPEPDRTLLVHDQHMTVTVEAHHGDLVDVRVLACRHQGNSYARKILLTLKKTGKVVQFGIVRVDLSVFPEAARKEIVEGKTPFGRILIQHDVHRRVVPVAYLRITPDADLMKWFGMTEALPIHGRIAYITCDGIPAVELLEVVAPESGS